MTNKTITIEYIESNKEGSLFLKLLQQQFQYTLTQDDYHFHYFLAHGRDFAGLVECQLDEDMQTIYIDKMLLNDMYVTFTLSTLNKALSKSFKRVYVGDSHWINDGVESKMFDVRKCPQVTIRKIFRIQK